MMPGTETLKNTVEYSKDATSTTLEILVCELCKGEINHLGFCAFDCSNDDLLPDERPARTVTVKTFRRVDVLLEERLYVRRS